MKRITYIFCHLYSLSSCIQDLYESTSLEWNDVI